MDASFTLSGKVTKTSGTATPTGVVVFENAVTGLPADSTTLDSSGNYSLATTFLPAGTYTLKAHYGGDTTYAPSDSTPVSVNLAKQASKVVVSFVTFTSTGAVSATALRRNRFSTAQTILFAWTSRMPSGTLCQNLNTGTVNFVCPTGTVNLLDGRECVERLSECANSERDKRGEPERSRIHRGPADSAGT